MDDRRTDGWKHLLQTPPRPIQTMRVSILLCVLTLGRWAGRGQAGRGWWAGSGERRQRAGAGRAALGLGGRGGRLGEVGRGRGRAHVASVALGRAAL